jgi:hypothetical protein
MFKFPRNVSQTLQSRNITYLGQKILQHRADVAKNYGFHAVHHGGHYTLLVEPRQHHPYVQNILVAETHISHHHQPHYLILQSTWIAAVKKNHACVVHHHGFVELILRLAVHHTGANIPPLRQSEINIQPL